jgi:metallo-beta-lactamase family protein
LVAVDVALRRHGGDHVRAFGHDGDCGNPEVRIHGRQWPVRARIAEIQGMSGHADRSALLRWLSALKTPPKRLFLTHGEEQVSLALAEHVRGTMGFDVAVPEYQEVVELR